MTHFDIAAEVERVNSRKLHDPDFWLKTGVPMPVKFLEDSIEIPESIKEPSLAMRLIGREVCSDTRSYDEAELRRAYNRRNDEKA